MSTLLSMLLPALVASGACALALVLSSGAPARVRLAIAALGLVCWVVPWPLLVVSFPWAEGPLATGWLTQIAQEQANTGLESIRSNAPIVSADGAAGAGLSTWLLALMLMPGLVMFLADVVRHRLALARWRGEAENGEELRMLLPRALRTVPYEIRLVPDQSVAAATGLRRGTIWIGRGLVGHAHLRAALVHECVHIARKDVLKLTAIAFVSRIWFWNPIVQYFARQARFLIEVVCDETCATLVGRREYRESLATLILDSQGARPTMFVPTIVTGRQDVARVVALGSTSRMHLRACVGLVFCTLGLAAAATLNAQADVDPRIGVWEEQKTSTHFESIRRVLENIPGGMTRMVVNAKLDAVNRQHVDFRCDGKEYPLLTASDRPTGVMYSCQRAGDRVVESLLTSVGVPASLRTTVREVVSEDGKTLTMSIKPGPGRMRIEETYRHFVRQQP